MTINISLKEAEEVFAEEVKNDDLAAVINWHPKQLGQSTDYNLEKAKRSAKYILNRIN